MLHYVFANSTGRIVSRSNNFSCGKKWTSVSFMKEDECCTLPTGAYIIYLPGRLAIFLDEKKNPKTVMGEFAASVILPPNYLRLLLPAYTTFRKIHLPLYGYTAVGFKNNKFFAAAKKIDSSILWRVSRHSDMRKLKKYQEEKIKQFPKNRILKHLKNCSINLGCFTANNIFFGKGEAGIPTTSVCNARCVGCISSYRKKSFSQGRIKFTPTVDEIVEIAVSHLKNSKENIVSFGQGCEGEPLLNFELLKKSISEIRKRIDSGSIHINTNGSIPSAIKELRNAGLNSIRVSLNSADEKNYKKYFRAEYSFADVERTLFVAKEIGLGVFLNILTFPGFTDRYDEIEKLFKLIRKVQPDMVQLRNLNIDPDIYISLYGKENRECMGMLNFLNQIKREFPYCRIGSFNIPYCESR